MKSLIQAILKVVSSFKHEHITQNEAKQGIPSQDTTPQAYWEKVGRCTIYIEDPAISSQRMVLRHAGESCTHLGAPVHWFKLVGTQIKVGVAPDVNNPARPWIHHASGMGMGASLYVDGKRINVKHEWRTAQPSYPPKTRRPAIA